MDTPCEVPSQEQEAEEEGMKPPLELANTVVALLDAANEVVDVEFLASGGYNYVWKVTFCKKLNRTIPRRDTSIQILVLRLPRQGPSLPPYQLRNEVAFLDYISRKLPNIPVPKVYAYEDGTDPDTIPFIAEEFIEGSNLEDVWFELPVEKKRSLCQRLADIVLDLAETRFTAIGGLDLNLNAAPTVQGGKIFKGRHKFHSSTFYNVGPYFTTKDFVLAAYDREICYYSHGGDDIEKGFFTRTSLPHWIEHLKSERQAIAAGGNDDLCKLIDEEPICICHGDFSTSNILVHDGNVVGVIDWEFAGTYPLSQVLGPIEIISLAEKHYRIDYDAADKETDKWNQQLLRDIESMARQRDWAEKNVKVLMGDNHDILANALFEMFPRDWMN